MSVHAPRHPGITRTGRLVENKFWWETFRQDVKKYVNACSVCAQTHNSWQLPIGPLQPLTISQWPWSHITIDFITDSHYSQGHTTIHDCFSKPAQSPWNCWDLVRSLARCLQAIWIDWGHSLRLWCSFHLLGMASLLQKTYQCQSNYHPQFNGQTERLSQDIGRFLRASSCNHQNDWNRFPPLDVYIQNSLIHLSTGLTPFMCVL